MSGRHAPRLLLVDRRRRRLGVTLHSPKEQDFSGKTLEGALAWGLVWLMAPEPGTGSTAGTLPRTQSTVSRMALFYRLHVLLVHFKEP
jgi:hypothetical protein